MNFFFCFRTKDINVFVIGSRRGPRGASRGGACCFTYENKKLVGVHLRLSNDIMRHKSRNNMGSPDTRSTPSEKKAT